MGGANQENQSELLEYYRLAYEKEKKKNTTLEWKHLEVAKQIWHVFSFFSSSVPHHSPLVVWNSPSSYLHRALLLDGRESSPQLESVGDTHVTWKIYHISIIIYLPHDREGPIPSLPKFPFNT